MRHNLHDTVGCRPYSKVALRALNPSKGAGALGAAVSLDQDSPFVLVVEDDQGCSELITEVVADLGYHVIVRDSAEEARDLLAERHPLLVVLDIMLPDADGFTVLSLMRSVPEMETVPVMLCTASLLQLGDRNSPVLDAHTEIVAKPFHIAAFAASLKRLLAG
jgi:two-component system OmpR family response regulator